MARTMRAAGRARRCTLQAAAALAAILAAGGVLAASPGGVPQGRTWDEIKALPDWSGNWSPGWAQAHMMGHGVLPYRDLKAPMTPAAAARFAGNQRLQAEHKRVATRIDQCRPLGFPGGMTTIAEMQVLFTPGQVTFSGIATTRRIYTDGRPHYTEIDTYNGDSTGHWEAGGVLVVDTVALDPGNEWVIGMPVGKNVHVVEHIRRVGDRLVDEVVVNAPEAFTTPYHTEYPFTKSDKPLIEYTCHNLDVNDKGEMGFDVSLPKQ